MPDFRVRPSIAIAESLKRSENLYSFFRSETKRTHYAELMLRFWSIPKFRFQLDRSLKQWCYSLVSNKLRKCLP